MSDGGEPHNTPGGAPEGGDPEGADSAEQGQPDQRDDPAQAPPTQPKRKSRLEQTLDDTDLGWGEAADPREDRNAHERWLRDQRPPHWG